MSENNFGRNVYNIYLVRCGWEFINFIFYYYKDLPVNHVGQSIREKVIRCLPQQSVSDIIIIFYTTKNEFLFAISYNPFKLKINILQFNDIKFMKLKRYYLISAL